MADELLSRAWYVYTSEGMVTLSIFPPYEMCSTHLFRGIANDSLRTDLCLHYPPYLIALGKNNFNCCRISMVVAHSLFVFRLCSDGACQFSKEPTCWFWKFTWSSLFVLFDSIQYQPSCHCWTVVQWAKYRRWKGILSRLSLACFLISPLIKWPIPCFRRCLKWCDIC